MSDYSTMSKEELIERRREINTRMWEDWLEISNINSELKRRADPLTEVRDFREEYDTFHERAWKIREYEDYSNGCYHSETLIREEWVEELLDELDKYRRRSP